MATSEALRKGMKVSIISGPYDGHTATVLDPTIGKDDHNRRKVQVEIDGLFMGDSEDPFVTWILPRSLDAKVEPSIPQPVAAMVTQVIAPVQQQRTVEAVAGQPDTRITDPMDPALDRFRPNESVVRRYISRTVKGGWKDLDYFLGLREQRDNRGFSPNIALVGDTQSGKTMLVQVLAVLAAERDGLPKPYPIFTISGNSGVTTYDLYGQPSAVLIDGKETLVWMEGLVPMAAYCGGILYLDEWNALPPSQAIAIHPLLDDRRMFVNTQKAVPDGHGGYMPEVVQAHEKLWVISTINPAGYRGTQALAEASTNRFRWMPWEYDEATEAKLIPSKTIRLLGDMMREGYETRVFSVPVGTSALERLCHDCQTFGPETALWIFSGMFPPKEQGRFEGVIEEQGILAILQKEYPTPTFNPESGMEEEEEV